MFGNATGSPENGYQLTEGRFGKISVIYDPNDTLVGDTFSPFHNAYGFINAAYNYQVCCVVKMSTQYAIAIFNLAYILNKCVTRTGMVWGNGMNLTTPIHTAYQHIARY